MPARVGGIVRSLLILLVVGTWIVASRSIPGAGEAHAQVGSKNHYGVVALNQETGEMNVNGAGWIILNATGLQTALQLAQEQGWKLHSVVSAQDGYVVILER